MARRRKQRRNRGSAKRSSSRKKPKTNPVVFQSIVAVVIVFATILLITLGVLTSTVGAVISVVLLGVIFYLMTTTQPKRDKRKRLNRPSHEEKVDSKEPKFYTALPSTLGVSETAQDLPKAQVNLPPRPIRAARRRRDFITYPLAVSGGDYSDSYIQIDYDTVLESVKKTNRAVCVEECWPFCGINSELSSMILENAFDYLDAPVKKNK